MTLHTFIFPRIYLNHKCAKPLFTYPSWSDILHLNPLCGLQKQKDRATASYIIFYCSEEKDPASITTKINTNRMCLHTHQWPSAGCGSSGSGSGVTKWNKAALQVIINCWTEFLSNTFNLYDPIHISKRVRFKEKWYSRITMPKYVHFQKVLIPQNTCNSFKYQSEMTEFKNPI